MDVLLHDCRPSEVVAPPPAMPPLTQEMFDGMDDMGAHLDAELNLITAEPFRWTPAQRRAQAEFVEAMRDGELKGPPTIFSELT